MPVSDNNDKSRTTGVADKSKSMNVKEEPVRPGLVTMLDVARQAKLSRATVSKIINKSGYVRPETVARVQEVIQRLGYRPNEMARSLVRQKSLTIGVLFPWHSDPWVGEILEYMHPLANEYGYNLVVYPSGDMSGDVNYSLDALMSWRVDALIAFVYLESNLIRQLSAQRIEVVSWGFPDEAFPLVHFICVDINLGLSRIATYLARLGHRNVAYIGYEADLMDILTKAYKLVRPDAEVIFQPLSDHTAQAGSDAVASLLAAAKPRPTAIVCRTDTIAIGVLSGLDHAGLRVPEDISVVGINDINLAQFTKPPLTTLRLSPQVIAKRMMDTTIAVLRDEIVPQFQPITPELVVRESTALPSI